MDRKKRSRNFSNRDRFLLTDVMKTEVKVIESKRHDGRSNDARKQAWKNVVNAFNARTDEKREEKQLAQLWRDMKRNAKKDHSRFRRQRMGTGGGPESAPLESRYHANISAHPSLTCQEATYVCKHFLRHIISTNSKILRLYYGLFTFFTSNS